MWPVWWDRQPHRGCGYHPYNASTNAGGYGSPSSRRRSNTSTTCGARPPITAFPLPSPPRLRAVGNERSYGVTLTANLGNLEGGATDGIYANTYVDPWLVMGSLFIPVIPTHTANLAGTGTYLRPFWVGQGVEAFGFTGDSTNVFKFNNNIFGDNPLFDPEVLKRWGIGRNVVLLHQPVVHGRRLWLQQGVNFNVAGRILTPITHWHWCQVTAHTNWSHPVVPAHPGPQVRLTVRLCPRPTLLIRGAGVVHPCAATYAGRRLPT